MTRFIDCHTHAQFAAFQADYKEVIGRALENNVFLVNVGTQEDTSRRAVEMAHEFKEGVYATVGIHPIHTDASHHDADELGLPQNNPEVEQAHYGAGADGTRTDAEGVQRNSASSQRGSAPRGFVSRAEEFDYEYYKKLALDSRVVAVGECGLDYYRTEKPFDAAQGKQKEVFVRHIELAREVKKPLMIHCRDAYDDLVQLLIANCKLLINGRPGIVHFFRGTKEDAKKLLDMGFYFTFGGVVTFVRDYDELVKYIPSDRILSETDAPYVTPVPYRGKRNEPVYVIEVVKKLAELKDVSVEKMRDQIWENTRTVFSL